MTVIEQWRRVLDCLNLPDQPRLLVCSPHDEDGVLTALSRLRPAARVAVLELTAHPRSRPTEVASCTVGRVDEATLASGQAPAQGRFHAALFDHALDDIIVGAVARHEGMERNDRAARARAVRAYWRSGDLETVARPALLQLIAACASFLSEGALMLFCHRVAPADLPDQPMDLCTDCLPLARSWLLSSDLGLRELPLDAFDPHWWMRLERA